MYRTLPYSIYGNRAYPVAQLLLYEEGYYCSMRFSPGYGDWVVSAQQDIFRLIDTGRLGKINGRLKGKKDGELDKLLFNFEIYEKAISELKDKKFI